MLTGYSTLAAVVAAVPVGILCLRSPVGRRVLVLAGPAASPSAVVRLATMLYGIPAGNPARVPNETVWALYLALAGIVAAFAVAAQRHRGSAGPLAASPGS